MKAYRGYIVSGCVALALAATSMAEAAQRKRAAPSSASSTTTGSKACLHKRCLDVVTSGKREIYAFQPDQPGGHYVIHPGSAGHPNPVPTRGVKDAGAFDTYSLITLEADPPHSTRCKPEAERTLVGAGTKVFLQTDNKIPVLYLMNNHASAEIPLKPFRTPTGDVLWLQSQAARDGFDYFVYFENAVPCKGSDKIAKRVRVEAYPIDPGSNAPDDVQQCFAERPDRPGNVNWSPGAAPKPTCESGGGSGGGNDHPN